MKNEYEIKEISDFLKVPADRIEDCLSEFKAAIDLTAAAFQIAEVPKGRYKECWPRFIWVDDGKKDIEIRIEE